ncbi:MAG: sigma-54-dependent Fis family transcriptional regulator [Acidobacteria bacterium]|nr:sigma-54-dependent Fis family transcriptional regulator [Acidobacteriota bacterium]
MQQGIAEINSIEKNSPAPAGGNHFFVPGASAAMRELERMMADIAPTNIPVLLVGESGTGKEVVAVQIHRLSLRPHDRFVKLGCATLGPESFNGGSEFHSAGGGANAATVLLDEISDLSAECQRKLLHVLPDEDSAAPLGTNARLICSTRRNLEQELRTGNFREELYYRINGVCLRIPPLRQRKEDLPALVNFFLTKYAAMYGRPRPSLTAEAIKIFFEHAWPGNVRELENVVKKIVALGDEAVALKDFFASQVAARPDVREDVPVSKEIGNFGMREGLSLKEAARMASRQTEREMILRVLNQTRWNRKRAAVELRISYKALLYKLKQIGMDRPAES